jgi:hypothetical protein
MMTGSHSALGIRFAACLSGMVIAIFAAAIMVSDIRARGIVDTASRLNDGARINEAALLHLDENRALQRAQNSCRHLDAAVTIRKAAVDQLTQFNTPQYRDAALDSLEDSLLQALKCEPLEGRYWLSLGQLHLALAGPDRTALDTLEMSRLTRPGESDVLIDRIVIMQWLHDAGVEMARTALTSDLAVALRHADPRSIAELYSAAQPASRALFHRELLLVPDERRNAIKERLPQLNAPLTQAQ